MAELRFISGTAALAHYGLDLLDEINGRIDDGNFNATGGLKASNTVTTTELGTGGAVLRLEAASHWKFLGNGRGPGRMPPLDPLVVWVRAKGLAADDLKAKAMAWGIAVNIANEGSLDHRLGYPNQYSEAITTKEDDFPEVLKAFLRDVDEPMTATFHGLLKRA